MHVNKSLHNMIFNFGFHSKHFPLHTATDTFERKWNTQILFDFFFVFILTINSIRLSVCVCSTNCVLSTQPTIQIICMNIIICCYFVSSVWMRIMRVRASLLLLSVELEIRHISYFLPHSFPLGSETVRVHESNTTHISQFPFYK